MLKLMIAVCIVALASQRASAQQCCQHMFIGDSPRHGQPGWHSGTQGLAHDNDHWYVTNTHNDKSRSLLWRIPVTTRLASNVACGIDGVSCSDLADLRLHAYNHYGDPDVYEFNGRAYVFVPVESGDAAAPPGVLIFRADATLEFLTFTYLTGQGGAPWVAVDGDGILYSSDFDSQAVINRFYLDWASFEANVDALPLPLSGTVRPTLMPVEPLLLQDENGDALDINKVQGGEFSDDDRRFYLSNGDGRNEAEPGEGLHVFTIQSADGEQCGPGVDRCSVARRIERSHNSSDPGFSFEFHPGANAGETGQEPEGLTYWDVGTGGQLHVVLLDNDLPDQEEVYVKHYTFTDIDSDPPVIVCPGPVIAECVSAGVPSSDSQLKSFFAGVSATDFCTRFPSITHDAPAVFPLGATPVTFTATDDSRNASTCQAAVTVVDTAAPTISVTLSHDTLWPADHRLVAVAAQVTAEDTCGASAIELVSISSNEPDDGIADGHTIGDIQGAEFGTDDTSFFLRAERAATGKGREYRVVYRVTDSSGNESVAAAVVRVPLSQ